MFNMLLKNLLDLNNCWICDHPFFENDYEYMTQALNIQWFLCGDKRSATTTNFQIFLSSNNLNDEEEDEKINTLNFSCHFLMISGKKNNT